METPPKVRRRFLGKTEDFENQRDKNFEKKHLKAYLRGNTQFRFGFENMNDIRVPKYHKVEQEYYYE